MITNEPTWNPVTQLWEGEDFIQSPPQRRIIDIGGRDFCRRGCGKPIRFGKTVDTRRTVTVDALIDEIHVCNPDDVRAKLANDLKMQPIRKRIADARIDSVIHTWSQLYHKRIDPNEPPLTDKEEMCFQACDERIKQIDGDNKWVGQL